MHIGISQSAGLHIMWRNHDLGGDLRMRWLTPLRAVILILIAIFSSHLQAEPESSKITLRVQGMPAPGSDNSHAVAEQAVIREFQKRHPEIILVSATGLQIEGIVPEATTAMMVAEGMAPDVIHSNFRSLDSFVREGMFAPLDKWIERDGLEGELAKKPQVQKVIHRPGPEGSVHTYGLPGSLNVVGLYYNKELFRMAGLPDRPPQDWNEMEEFANKIRKLGPQYWGILLTNGNIATWNLMNFIWSAGGDAVQEVAPNDWRAVFNSPEAREAYLFYYKLVEIDRVAKRGSMSIVSNPTEQRKIGMFFGYVGDESGWDPDIFGFGAVPKGPNGKRGSEINTSIFGIFSQIKDPMVREAAWQYIRFITSEEADAIRIRTLVDLGETAQINPVSLKQFGYNRLLALIPSGLERELHEALENGHPEPYGKNCNLIYTEMGYPLDEILLSQTIYDNWRKGDKAVVQEAAQTILDNAVKRTNERMINYVPPEKMRTRRIVAAMVMMGIVGAFIGVGFYVSGIFLRSARMMNRPVGGRTLRPLLYLAPMIILLIMWDYVPLMRGTMMVFLDYRLLLPSVFVGVDNFANVLFDSTFWKSVLATFQFAAWTLTLGFFAPIFLAYLLHIIPRHKIIYRTIYYLPAVITASAVFFLWRELFGVDGVLNEVLHMLGFEARRAWTDDPHLAMLSCVIPGIWAGAGPGCLIYLAALKTIPIEQFAAAEIDGAGFFKITTTIVFPSLKPLILITFVGAVMGAFHGATNILIMTGGGPNGATEVASLKIFYEAFTRLRFGPATTMAWILGSMLVGFAVIQLQRISRMEFKTAK